MSRILRTQVKAGRRIDDLSNGNVLIDGVEVVPPDHWPQPDTRWAMRDVHGNLIIGSQRDDQEPVLIERDPTSAEAQAKIAAEMEQLQRSVEHRQRGRR
jgi:hypothetical protein